MPYPLIILGAGASRGYSDFVSGPPVTKELIRPDFFDNELLKKYDGAGTMFSRVSAIMHIDQQKSFEQAIQEVTSKKTALDLSQLVDLQYYLRDLFKIRSHPDSVHPINHYKALTAEIGNTGNHALVVSFNYDSLFEQNLTGYEFKHINDYVKGSIKIVKVHGSHNWSYIEGTSRVDLEWIGHKDFRSFLKMNPTYFSDLRIKQNIAPVHEKQLTSKTHFFEAPAIAIPIPDKNQNDFVCPKQHIEILNYEISKVDRVLIIGWRAGDPALLEFLRNKLSDFKIKVTVVLNSIEGGEAVISVLRSFGYSGNPRIVGSGFAGFVGGNGIMSDFFNE